MKLPVLSGQELIKILSKAGFEAVRQKGSHVYLKHAIEGQPLFQSTAIGM